MNNRYIVLSIERNMVSSIMASDAGSAAAAVPVDGTTKQRMVAFLASKWPSRSQISKDGVLTLLATQQPYTLQGFLKCVMMAIEAVEDCRNYSKCETCENKGQCRATAMKSTTYGICLEKLGGLPPLEKAHIAERGGCWTIEGSEVISFRDVIAAIEKEYPDE